MKTTGGSDAAKRRAGERAAEEVEDGMVVGLGTGSTTAYAIEAIGRAVGDGLDIRGVPTSFQSRRLALEVGISLTDLDAVAGIDLAIDGADRIVDGDADRSGEIDGGDAIEDDREIEDGTLIKGGGAAHTREKLVAAAAERFVVVADPSKLTPVLDRPVPLEVLSDAHTVVSRRVRELGGEAELRAAERKDGPVVTDNGNLVLDCDFGRIDDASTLGSRLSEIPGVLEHGLFVDLADSAYIGTADGLEKREY